MQWKPILVVLSCWGLVNATQKHNSLSCWSRRVSLAQWTVSGALPRHQNYFLDPGQDLCVAGTRPSHQPVTTTTQTGWSFFWVLLNLLQWRRQNTLSKIFQLKILIPGNIGLCMCSSVGLHSSHLTRLITAELNTSNWSRHDHPSKHTHNNSHKLIDKATIVINFSFF